MLAAVCLAFVAAQPARPAHLDSNPAASGPWLTRLNAWRASVGLPNLTENTTWSAGDASHAYYMVKTGLVTHGEDPANPYYTAAGDVAGQNSNIFVSSSTATTDSQSIDWWMAAPFHAMAMMDPRLSSTGFGSYRDTTTSPWQMGAAVDTSHGNSSALGLYTLPTFFPGNGSTEPLTSYSGNETPNPQAACPGYSGLPIFIEVGGNISTTAGAHTLSANGTLLNTCTIDSTNASFASYLTWRGAVILMPQNPLVSGTTYVVTLTVNLVPYTWSFTVGGGPTPASQQTVVKVAPNSGPSSGGTSVTITGTGFSNGTTAVKFGTAAAASFSVVNDTTITAVSPAQTVSSVDVTVTTASGTSGISPLDQFTFTGLTSYFQWFDLASVGMMNDNIHLLNTSGSTANVTVTMPGASGINVVLASGAQTHVSFGPGHIGGPVLVNADQSVLASQRVQFEQSFNEVWAKTAAQAVATSYINWYDKASNGMLNDNIHVLNPGGTTANVAITLPGAPTQNLSIAPGAESYATFPQGSIGGPVTVTSSQPVLASQRVQFQQSFNEVWAQGATQAASTSYINWYDKASNGMLNDNIHVLNPGLAAATVTISTPGATSQHLSVPAGGEAYANFPAGTIGGPVTVSSVQPVLASQRVQFAQSFNEVWAESASQASATSHVVWYDKASPGMMNDNIHILNPGGTAATVTVSLLGAPTQNLIVPAGGEAYATFPQGTIGGPVTVTVTSGPAVLASQRVQYYSSFNEIWTA
ncbi:MAG: hypothetical protein E6J20_02245 [Chloroflexi bacterium]|nr:MAG: hypothetical protein E6J20_02245 [Chloroflexota bacterium]